MSLYTRHWRLDGADTTLLLAARDDEIPTLLWLGQALPETLDLNAIAQIGDIPIGMAKADTPVPLSLFPQESSGLDAPPALLAHRHGAGFAHRLTTRSVDCASEHLLVVLEDVSAGIEVRLTLALDPVSGVLSITTDLRNTATTDLEVNRIASGTLPLTREIDECLYLHGRWGLEFQTCRTPIGPQGLTLQNHRGRTSHEHFPGVICGSRSFNETQGSVLAAHLAWSGSHQTQICRLADGRACLQTGIALQPGELILAAGESYQTPSVYLATAIGIRHASSQLHRYARSHILPRWTRSERPVHANSWEALYFDHSSDKLFELIDAAKRIGAERFVLDDGWFRGRRNDDAGLGDWTIDRDIYPQGLHAVVERVRTNGMQFGLWFEPEMVNPDSDLYRQHPDWVLHATPYDTPLARNQLALNMDLPEVQRYLFDHMERLIDEYSIDYIKWDLNRDLVLAGDGTRNQMHLQPGGCYTLMARLNERFPGLEIESCASGGARADWGVLQHTGRVWTSDSIDALDRAAIQRGYSLFCPPEIMGAHVGHERAHLTGRSIDIHTRAIVALQGQFGYEVDARHLDADEHDTLQYYANLYKKHRCWIAESLTVRLDSSNPALLCSGLVARDKSRSLWFAIAGASVASAAPGNLYPEELNPDARYQLALVSGNRDDFASFCKHLPVWMEQPVTIQGATLMKFGLTLPIMPVQSALLIDVTQIES